MTNKEYTHECPCGREFTSSDKSNMDYCDECREEVEEEQQREQEWERLNLIAKGLDSVYTLIMEQLGQKAIEDVTTLPDDLSWWLSSEWQISDVDEFILAYPFLVKHVKNAKAFQEL